MRSIILNCWLVCFLCAGLLSAPADTQTWSVGAGDWFTVDNWTNTLVPADTRVPVAGDDVVVTNLGAVVYLTNSTAWLSSLVISNAIVSCSNWDTTLYVTNLTIKKSGVLTCIGSFTNNVISNRVSLNCATLFVETNGAINVNGKGFPGGSGPSYGNGRGPGGGVGIAGASYGGSGVYGQGGTLRTNIYGSVTAPLDPGSGGGGGSAAGSKGGSGGGAVCITAVQVVVNGSISANASNDYLIGSHCSGGSGGGIYITCTTIAGTNGAITANAGNPSGGSLGGGAGGGRIAVIYDQGAQGAISPVPSISFSVASTRSGGQTTYLPGDIGTLYFPDNYFFSPSNLFTGQWLAPEHVNVAVSEWMVTNVWTRVSADSITVANTITVAGTNKELFKLEVTNNSVISCGRIQLSGASLIMGYNAITSGINSYLNLTTSGPRLNCSGDLMLTNASHFYIAAGLTNSGAAAGYGARVIVDGDVRVASNCWITPIAHATNGAVVAFSARNITLDYGGGFDANGWGYGGGLRVDTSPAGDPYGPGSVPYNGGGGYGGKGSNGYYHAGGTAYGSSNAPVAPGSGAAAGRHSGSGNGPHGGGSVQINATETVTINGTVMANSGNSVYSYGPGASGGGIYITCRTFIGNSNGVLQANGGAWAGGTNYGGGGGGGGRIAVWRIFDNSASVISNYVNGGLGWGGSANTNIAESGTIVWGWRTPPNGTIVTIY